MEISFVDTFLIDTFYKRLPFKLIFLEGHGLEICVSSHIDMIDISDRIKINKFM